MSTNPTPIFSPKQIRRFWARINKTPGQGPKGECWEWMTGRDKDGYGKLNIRHQKHVNSTYQAHRVAFFLTHGRWPTPNGCHVCDNPPCCNPSHIWEGTHATNLADARQKGRRPTKNRPATVTIQRFIRDERAPQHARGEDQHLAKLTDIQVRQIRDAAKNGSFLRIIAARHDVSISTISRVVRGEIWTHIPT